MRKINLFAILILFLATFGIAFTNYQPGTFLSGWDNLHSEFNITQHIVRSLNSVWQDYEATGTLVGVGDASDLPRLIYLWILSWVLPTSLIRYVFHFSMLFIGTVGTYFAIKNFFINREGKIRYFAALFGSLFYLLNLGTSQYFSTPFEPFSVYWAMFPWLIFGTFRYLQNPTRKNLALFALLHFLATPMFYLQTVFYIYVLVLGLVCISYFFAQRTKKILKTVFIAFFVFISVNAFWLFPHFYWFATNRSVQQSASMNTLTTNETIQRVQQFGNLTDFMLFKNKAWDYRDFTIGNDQFLLQPWHDYFNQPSVQVIGYILFIVALFGLVTNKTQRGFSLGLAIICFIILANQAPIARELNYLFRQIDIVNQVLRDPFTKFIVPTIFIFAVGFSGGIVLLSKVIPKRAVKPLSFIGSVVIGGALVVYMLPVFTGHLIADRMKVAIPQYYFDFFDYMGQQDATKRIANLPQGPIWGWTSTEWGYTGSGFLWHGLAQPVLDRPFDVWNDKNEEYYWEVAYALNKRDYALFQAVLQKYGVAYVIFDSALFFPDNPNSKFETIRQKEFIDSSLKKIKSFGSIDVYETNVKTNKYVSIISKPAVVTTNINWLGEDKANFDFGNYINGTDDNSQVTYPFRSLFSGRGSKDISYHVTATTGAFIFSEEIPAGKLIFPQGVDEEFISFDAKTLKPTKEFPQIVNNGTTILSDSAISKGDLEVFIPKDNRYGSFDSAIDNILPVGSEVVCDQKDASKKFAQSILDDQKGKFVRFTSTNARTCRVIYLSGLSHRSGYIVAVKARHQKGNTLQFWIENITAKRSSPQVFLTNNSAFDWEYFIIPPMAPDGVGYTLHFDNVSIGKQEAMNDLAQVIVQPVPYKFLTGMKVVTGETPVVSVTDTEAITSVSHPLFSTYYLQLDSTKIQERDTIALYQTYDSGWSAYVVDGWWGSTFPMIFGEELKGHVMMNNWANGWNIGDIKNDKIEIVIIFWPQLLQYLGFILLPVPFIYALWPRKKKRSET